MISAQGMHLMRGGRTLLKETGFCVYPGEKIGVLGKNGCGKSSLFSAICGHCELDAGELNLSPSWRVAIVKQHVTDLARSVIDYIIDGHQVYRQLQQALSIAEKQDDGIKIAAIYGQFEQINAYAIDAQATTLASGLGFSQHDLHKPLKQFSGGWQNRASLAQAMMMPSDLILLDEPTNHLDLDAVMWLEQWIKRYTGAVLLISHDRDFLDAVTEKIFFLAHQKITTYNGNFSACEQQRLQELTQQQAAYEKQQQKREHLMSFVTRFRAKASKAKQAQSRLKMLDKMVEISVLNADSPFHFHFPKPENLPMPLLQLRDAQIGYDAQKPVLHQVNFELHPGSRIGLLGHNGAGKTTLMRAFAANLSLLQGKYIASHKLKVGYFTQQQIEMLDHQASPLQHLSRISPESTEQKCRHFLGGFGFCGDQALSPVAPFSGGEKARLALALLVWQAPNVLLLDEPTNHLDMDMRDALTHALLDFSGALVVISHDRHLLRATCDHFLLVDQHQVQLFDGTIESYYTWIQQSKPAINTAEKPTATTQKKHLNHKQKESQLKKYQSTLIKEEKIQEKLQVQLAQIATQLADESLYQGKKQDQLHDLLQSQANLNESLQASEARWLECQAQIEQFEP